MCPSYHISSKKATHAAWSCVLRHSLHAGLRLEKSIRFGYNKKDHGSGGNNNQTTGRIGKGKTMKEIRLGTIGSGVIVRTILDQVQKTDGISLCAVYSRNQKTGKALADAYGCGRVYTDLDAMLADKDVNTVYIATPNLLHFAQAEQALLAGKHVILEKPFVTTLSQAKALAALAKKRHLLLVEAVPTPYLPNYAVLKRLLPQIGTVKLVLSNYSQYSARYRKLLQGELPNIFNPLFGGGCLMDLNFYNVYLNIALFGNPSAARYEPVMYPGAADTNGVMLLRYDGFLSVNAAAKDASGTSFFQIEGEKGQLCVENGANGLERIRLVLNGETQTYNEQPRPNRWWYEVQALTDLFLREDDDSACRHLAVTLDTVAVMEAARKQAGIFFPGDEKPAQHAATQTANGR